MLASRNNTALFRCFIAMQNGYKNNYGKKFHSSVF